MEKVKTIGIYRDYIDILSEAINEELEKNNITADMCCNTGMYAAVKRFCSH